MQRSRPLGITIIAILAILGGIGSIVSGFTVLAIIPLFGIILGAILIIIGLAYFAVAYGLWKGLGWAWTLTLIVSIIGIIAGLASIASGNSGSIFHIIVDGIIIYYLYRPNVKAYFGKQ